MGLKADQVRAHLAAQNARFAEEDAAASAKALQGSDSDREEEDDQLAAEVAERVQKFAVAIEEETAEETARLDAKMAKLEAKLRARMAADEAKEEAAEKKANNIAQREANALKKEQLQHAETITLAKQLAHNDVKVRNKSIRKVRNFLVTRPVLNATHLLKVFKGIFYCFWMSDKVPVQQQLADALSDLLLAPLSFDRSLLLFSACLTTLRREWTAIDQLRMDKFMTLARRFLQKALMAVQAGGWEKEQVEALTDVIIDSGAVAHDTPARGFAFHVIDCFLPEVERVAASASSPAQVLSFEAFNTLLTPFYHILARSHDRSLVSRVSKEVFDVIRDVCATPLELEEEKEEVKPKKAAKVASKAKKSKKKASAVDEDEDMEDAEADADEEEEELPQAQGPAVDFPAVHPMIHGNGSSIAEVLFTLATDKDILPRSRKVLYAYHADFTQIQTDMDALGAEQEAEEEEEEEAPVAVMAIPTKGRKRKAASSEEADPILAGVGSEALAVGVKERAKKRNKKQRLADKRKKKENIFGGEPGQAEREAAEAAAAEAQQDGEISDDYVEVDDEDVDMDEAADLVELDLDVSDSELEAVEDARAAAVITQPISKKEQKRLEQARAKTNQDKQSKGTKRIVPQVVEEEADEIEEEEEEPEPIVQQPKKKQRVSVAPAAPVAAPVAAVVAKAIKPAKAAAPASPVAAPSQPTTPPKVKPSSVGFSTPQAKAPVAAPVVGGTVVRPSAVAPPSSSKKAVRIMLQNNQVKQFNRFSRDSVTTQTTALLAKPSPGSAIKPTSMEFFLAHNKNGRELAARQSLLSRELSAAATSPSPKRGRKSTESTPPTSPRAKAADYFFTD